MSDEQIFSPDLGQEPSPHQGADDGPEPNDTQSAQPPDEQQQGQEPGEQNAQGGDPQAIDLESLPEEVRGLIEHLLEKVRKANREARALRKRLKAQGKAGDASKPAAGGEGDDDADAKARLKQLEAELERYRQQVRQVKLQEKVRQLAVKAGFRPEAVDEVQALVRLNLGDEAWDGDQVDEDAIQDYLADLRKTKPYLLKPKRKPQQSSGGQQQRRGNQRLTEDELAQIRARFGI